MKMSLKIVLMLLLVSLSDNFAVGMFYKSNSTDLTVCNISYSRNGSVYGQFYPLDIKRNQALMVDFHFAVLAMSDAHILLAESENVSKSDPAYEIVIGAGGNTFSDIRRMQKSEVKASVRIKNLLSALDPQFFWIHVTKNDTGGLLQVGKEGENKSFIEWFDRELLPIKYISFSVWSGIEAKWYFNCDRGLSEEEFEKTLPPILKLKRRLLGPYDPLVRPGFNISAFTEVHMGLTLEHLELDEYKSTIEIYGSMVMKWQDDRLQWDPASYDNIQHIGISRNAVWKPDIISYNAVENPSDILQDATVFGVFDGEIIWKPAIHVKAVCDGFNLGEWPRDIHTCKLLFTFVIDNDGITLNFSSSDSNLLQHRSSQWTILNAVFLDLSSSNISSAAPSFGIYFEIQRSSLLYELVFFLPFLVISTCLLASFWIPPSKHLKLSLGCSQLVLEVIMLLTIVYFMPPSSTGIPFLVALYGWCLAVSSLSLLLSIVIINISNKKHMNPLPHSISKLLTSAYATKALCLPKVMMPEEYGNLDLSLSFNNLSRAEINDDKGQRFWLLLTLAMDRLAFLLCIPLMMFVIIKYTLLCSV